MNSTSRPQQVAAVDALRFATIEAGGTKFNVGIGGRDGEVYDQAQFATRSPAETIGDVTSWLDTEVEKGGPLAAIGVATFGPIDTDPASARWGHLGLTPKLSWRGADLITPFRRYGVPLALDTDVNGAALAEWRWGAGRGCARICYLTVGTGIGGGAVLDGKMLSGRSHPEMGHMFVRRHPDDEFVGACPTHGDCLEGLASGNTIKARWGRSLSRLEVGHPGHLVVASYLAQACLNIVATLAPEKIILGGGVMGTPGLVANVRDQFNLLANGYFSGFGAEHIALAELFPISGLVGGLAIAELALNQNQNFI
ncbi:ROK family protein [Sphingomonas koreensis]|nr:ROK family protein [Sphingomonas koreensis]